MTLEDIQAIVQTPGWYCLTRRRDGRQISQHVMIWALWESGACAQGRGAPHEPILATAEGWVLLHDVISLSAYNSKNS